MTSLLSRLFGKRHTPSSREPEEVMQKHQSHINKNREIHDEVKRFQAETEFQLRMVDLRAEALRRK